MESINTNVFYKCGEVAETCNDRPHAHNFYQVIFVMNGYCDFLIDDKLTRVSSPSVLLLNPFQKHIARETSSDYKRFILEMNQKEVKGYHNNSIDALFILKNNNNVRLIPFDEKDEKRFKHLFSHLIYENEINDAYSTDARYFIIGEIFTILIRKQPIYKKLDSYAMMIKDYIDENFIYLDSIKTLAEKFSLSPSRLSHIFKTATGFSTMEFILKTKLSYASTLLMSTDKTVLEICLMSGFNDINNFIRQFKNLYGTTPQKYRLQHSLLDLFDTTI